MRSGATSTSARERRISAELPSALAGLAVADPILEELHGRRAVVFLDYDGTLTPIVERPEDALLSEETRQAVRRLARRCPVAVVSGRGLDDVRGLVGIEEIYYAGSHGFRIAGPHGSRLTHDAGVRFVPAVERAERALREALGTIAGAQIESKGVSVAVHCRRVAPDRRREVEEAVRAVAGAHAGQLALTRGKMVFELRPDLDWHKGRAVTWLLEALDLDRPETLPIFVGDDTTDEDAFGALEDRGLGILVRDERRPTTARYALEDPLQVRLFIEALAAELAGAGR